MEVTSPVQGVIKYKKKSRRTKNKSKNDSLFESKSSDQSFDTLIRSFEEHTNINKELDSLNDIVEIKYKKTKKKHKTKNREKENSIGSLDSNVLNEDGHIKNIDGEYTLNSNITESNSPIVYKEYESELQMPDIMQLIQKDLSEPYSIYTYRYFIHNWPKLCFLAIHGEKCVGAIVCKLDMHKIVCRGYIAMLAVDKDYRKMKIGSTLVQKAIEAMLWNHADEVVLETEITNFPALKLYENLGFVRDKRLFHYYLNGVDALRLKLWFR